MKTIGVAVLVMIGLLGKEAIEKPVFDIGN